MMVAMSSDLINNPDLQSDEFGMAVCKQMGIDVNLVSEMKIIIQPNQPIIVRVDFFVKREHLFNLERNEISTEG